MEPHWTCLAQGTYYAVTGIWPFVSMRTFLKITGPKTDLWLVRTVGALILASGLALVTASLEQPVSAPITVLAMGQAVALALIDLRYSLNGTISRIYLLDAAAEGALLLSWLL